MKFPQFLLFLSLIFSNTLKAQNFDTKYVVVTNDHINQYTVGIMKMSRQNNHVKVKYFAGADKYMSVANRYKQWAQGKNIIMYSSGTYYDKTTNSKPVGICIDNGKLVNDNVLQNEMDALAIVYNTGGIAVSDLKKGDLTISDQNGFNSKVNVRDPFDAEIFKNWAMKNNATVFQTHLLCYNNEIKVLRPAPNSSAAAKRERRFLAVCQDKDGSIQHLIINIKENVTIYEGATAICKYILHPNNVFLKIFFLINLDTGAQDIFKSYDGKGNIDNRKLFGGTESLDGARNLLVYYYE